MLQALGKVLGVNKREHMDVYSPGYMSGKRVFSVLYRCL